jgi:hypothetical protein
MVSQLVFIEEKSDAIGLDFVATKFWTKKSAHVVFRRPLKLESNINMNLEIETEYRFYFQYGLFDSEDDTDESKLNGNLDMDDFNTINIVPVSNESMLSGNYLICSCLGLFLSLVISI